GLEAPCIVHGHAGLPVAPGEALRRDVLLRGLGVTFIGSTQTVVPDQVGVLVEKLNHLSGALGRHGLRGGIEPDDDGKLFVVFKELLDLGNGLVVEVIVEATILRGIPVAGVLVMVTANGSGSA